MLHATCYTNFATQLHTQLHAASLNTLSDEPVYTILETVAQEIQLTNNAEEVSKIKYTSRER